jgi:iron complex outermembrane receptor protein
LEAAGNLSISKNKIRSFTQYLDDYDSNFEWIGQKGTAYRHTDIAFSPRVVGGATLTILPAANMELSLSGKYVSRQYLDNSQDVRRKLDAYYTQDARLVFTVKNKLFNEWKIIGQVNNLLNAKYEPNGYTYGYIYDGTAVNENFYFPMAGIHFMVALNIKL